jgi:hypothetical protein
MSRWRAEFFNEFERNARAILSVGDGVGAIIPGAQRGAGTERIRTGSTKRVPVNHRKAQMIAHRFAFDFFGRVIVFESQRVFGSWSFEFDFRDVLERGAHD